MPSATCISLIAACPNVFIGGGLDELRSDADAVARALNRTLDDSIKVQFACYFRQRLV